MPRVKRFQNPLKLAASHNSSSSNQAPTQAHANSQPANEVSQKASTQSSSSSESPMQYAGRESKVWWNVEIIDLENTIKKIKIKVKEVNNMPRGERVVVDFDDHGASYGEAQGLLAGYLGILASDAILFPISFEKWIGDTGMPKTYKEECFQTMIKPRFSFNTSKSIAYRYCNGSLGKKWAANSQRIWNEFYNPALTRDEIYNNVPMGIPRDQWAAFVNYRFRPSTIELCRKNKHIRSKQTIPHTCGSKSNSRRRHEMLLETGEIPSRGKMYIETHKRKNGLVVNDEARAIVEQIQLNMTQSGVNQSKVSPNDVVGKVFGPEHSGRVRCMGMGAAPTNTFRSTTTHWQHNVTILETKLQGTLNALKAYMIAKEGGILEEFIDLFAIQPEPNDVRSEHITPSHV